MWGQPEPLVSPLVLLADGLLRELQAVILSQMVRIQAIIAVLQAGPVTVLVADIGIWGFASQAVAGPNIRIAVTGKLAAGEAAAAVIVRAGDLPVTDLVVFLQMLGPATVLVLAM